jgi:type II secretory pathway pseudopilin PulG
MVELIFSLVIIGIIGVISTQVIVRVYEAYIVSREVEQRQGDARRVLDIIAARLQHRVKNSVIGRNSSNPNEGFLPINDNTIDTSYNVLEWIGIAYESQRGLSLSESEDTLIGWSGVARREGYVYDPTHETHTVDLNSSLSHLDRVGRYEWEFNATTVADPAIDPDDALKKLKFVYAGTDTRGDFVDVNRSNGWGWRQPIVGAPADNPNDRANYFDIVSRTGATQMQIRNQTGTTVVPFSVSATDNIVTYYLVRSAYAIFTREDGENRQLVLAYNYRPWEFGSHYANAPQQVLMDNVTNFLFREEGNVLRIILCAKASDEGLGSDTEFCRERVLL